MKNWKAMTVFLSVILFPGSMPYEPEYKIEPPCTQFIYKHEEPKAIDIPPRRNVPEEYREMFTATVEITGIPLEVLESIAFVESGFDPAAMSPMGESGRQDLGMFQFNNVYLDWYAETYNAGVAFDPMFPGEAAIVAAKHICFLYDRYGHWPTVFLAYNAGMTAVDNDVIPDCSFRYLIKIYHLEIEE